MVDDKRKTSPDHPVAELHAPNFALQTKLGGRGTLGSLFTPTRIRAGQQAIEDFKSTYFDDISSCLEPLHLAIAGTIERNSLLECVRSLKGHAESLGFEFILEVCHPLIGFMSEKEAYLETDILIIQKHVEAILAGVKKKQYGKGGDIEEETLRTLRLLRDKLNKRQAI